MSDDHKRGDQPQAPNPELQARIKQLEEQLAAATERAETAEALANTLQSEGSTRSYSEKPVRPATSHKPLWPFLVKVSAKPAGHPEVPEQRIDAVDESEAIRQFCLMSKDDKGRQLDPTRYQFSATCLRESDRAQQRLNKINNRRLVKDGKLPVLDRRQELLDPEANKLQLASA